MLPPRCHPCDGVGCSRSTTRTWWIGPSNGSRKFNEAAPALFGQNFPRDVSEYLNQVDSLKKAKSKPQSSGFQKTYSHQPANKPVFCSQQQKWHPTHKFGSKEAISKRSLASDN